MSKTGLIVALDYPDLPKAEALARELGAHVDALKVGLTLFSAYGPEAIMEIAQHAPVFCDLKLHDIPAQVGNAVMELARQGVWMLTVHASGGSEMISAAAKGAASVTRPPLVAGVTVLTSLDDSSLGAVGQGDDSRAQVMRLAELALAAGATALVCSPLELALLRDRFGDDVVIVTPGIRAAGDDRGDQARVMTPAQAAATGASFIVVGRPITSSADPIAAAKEIKEQLG